MSTLRRRIRVFGLAIATVAATLVSAPAPAVALAPVSSSHPYSFPLYWPLRVETGLDCVRNNPGCTSPRDFWAMSLVPTKQSKQTSRAGVFAMGAGILHVGNARGTSCGHGNSFGTWVWIDHGAGKLSRYGHFSKILVKDGSRVVAGQAIGVVGTTGKNSNCQWAYTNVMLEKNGEQLAHSVEITTLKACMHSSRTAENWPSARFPRSSTWNRTPKATVFPATSSSCLPRVVPDTLARPAWTSLARSGRGQLTIRWKQPTSTPPLRMVMIELARRHGDGTYDTARNQAYRHASPKVSSYEFSALRIGNTYRTRVSFSNDWGWSVASSWKLLQVR